MNNFNEIKSIAIYGAGGFGLEVAMLIEQINLVKHRWKTIGFFDDGLSKGTIINERAVLGGLNELNDWSEPLAVVCAIGMPSVKRNIVKLIKNPCIYFPTLMHPSVICGASKYLQIGQGSIICAGTLITTNIDIGSFVTLNLSCTVGHQVTIGNYCSFMPSCNISGEVTIGENSFWGTGAKAINRLKIGSNTIIGAGAVVINEIPNNATAVGVPAKIIKTFDP